MSELLRLAYGFEVRGVEDEKRSLDVIASTTAIDSYGEIVVQDWDLKRYLNNPVVLFGHSAWDMPIGHASNVRVENNQLLATLHLVDEKANPMAERVWQGVKQGSLRAVSVGFRTKGNPSTAEVNGKPVLMLTGNELVEISIVAIPANPEAIALQAKAFQDIRALAERGASTETPNMSILVTLAAVLSLPSSSTEADIVGHAKAVQESNAQLRGDTKKLLEATGVDSVEKALGVIAAGKEAIALSISQARQLEDLERTQIISKAKQEHKLTPAQEKALEGKSLDFVKSFVELQVPNPVLSRKVEKEASYSGDLTWKGKKYSELSFGEKHELSDENPELYAAMREAEGLEAA